MVPPVYARFELLRFDKIFLPVFRSDLYCNFSAMSGPNCTNYGQDIGLGQLSALYGFVLDSHAIGYFFSKRGQLEGHRAHWGEKSIPTLWTFSSVLKLEKAWANCLSQFFKVQPTLYCTCCVWKKSDH